MITFFLVPIYTASLSTSDYGTADLVSTIAMVLVPILTLNIGEAVMRFSLDENADYNKIMSVGIAIAIISTCIGFFTIPLWNKIEQISQYSFYIALYCITQGVYQIVVCYLRGTERLTSFAFSNIIHVLSTAILNILLLVIFKGGLKGYFTAYILGYIIGSLYAIYSGKILKVLCNFKWEVSLSKAMVKYSIVLVPTSLMWWIMNSSDRIMVTAMIGTAANGIYAVAYKVPTIVSTMSTVFNQAWSYSAIREDKSNDREEFNNQMFDSFIKFQLLITAGLLMIIKPFISIYVSSSYFESWKYTPYLLVGYLFMSLGTFLSTSYTVNKDSKGFLVSGMTGAGVNIILNFILIPVMGVSGAALATCISYITVFCYRIIDTRKYLKINIKKPIYGIGVCVILVMVVTLLGNWKYSFYALILEFVCMLLIEKKFIVELFEKVCLIKKTAEK